MNQLDVAPKTPVAKMMDGGVRGIDNALSANLTPLDHFGSVGAYAKTAFRNIYDNAKNDLIASANTAVTSTGASSNAAGSDGSWASTKALAKRLGLTVTSTTGGKHANGSWHYDGDAIDFSNGYAPTPEMDAFYAALQPLAASGVIGQLIYKHHGWQQGSAYNYTGSDHFNHVHVGIRGEGSSTDRGRGGSDRTGDAPARIIARGASKGITPASRANGGPGGEVSVTFRDITIHNRSDIEDVAAELAADVWKQLNNMSMESGSNLSD
jgi:hypothetical protein